MPPYKTEAGGRPAVVGVDNAAAVVVGAGEIIVAEAVVVVVGEPAVVVPVSSAGHF